jgi:hypothetical protein
VTATNPKSIADSPKSKASDKLKWWQWLLMYPTLAVAILGAVPTVMQEIQAIKIGVSYNQVPYAISNDALFAKNVECFKQTGQTITLSDNTSVEAVVCQSGMSGST